jgi:YedE family putative selenium metabolism protein
MKNLFGTRWGIIGVGAAIGILAPLLQNWGNPPNMGICVACFERDIAGSLGLHRAAVVQYLRPEIIAFVIGSFIAALLFKEFKPRTGSAPVVRFFLGVFAMIGALVFLGCPWRALIRLSAGDGNAIIGIIGLIFGIYIGTRFLKMGFNLGRSEKTHYSVGLMMPILMVGLIVLAFIFSGPGPAAVKAAGAAKSVKSGVLWYSIKGPGAMHAAVIISILAGLAIGFLAQRSRFCTMGAFRDLILFKIPYLFLGVAAFAVFAFGTNLVLRQFHAGFIGQPIAHHQYLWNFLGMTLAGLAFCLAGGCPGRQLFLSGEGDADAAVFVLGMIVGAAMAHNFGLAAVPDKMAGGVLVKAGGIGPAGMIAVGVGLALCVFFGLTMRQRA